MCVKMLDYVHQASSSNSKQTFDTSLHQSEKRGTTGPRRRVQEKKMCFECRNMHAYNCVESISFIKS